MPDTNIMLHCLFASRYALTSYAIHTCLHTGGSYIKALTLILRLRQVCNHYMLVPHAEKMYKACRKSFRSTNKTTALDSMESILLQSARQLYGGACMVSLSVCDVYVRVGCLCLCGNTRMCVCVDVNWGRVPACSEFIQYFSRSIAQARERVYVSVCV